MLKVNPTVETNESSLQLSDEQLAERAGKEGWAMASLYQRHFEKINRYVRRRVSPLHEAEDVTSQIFLAMVRGLPKWKQCQIPFLAWLYRLSTNAIISWARRRKVKRFFGLVNEPIQMISDCGDEVEELHQALSQTPEPFQTILTLHYLEELSVEAISLISNTPVGTVKSRLNRGRALLRQAMETRHRQQARCTQQIKVAASPSPLISSTSQEIES